MKKLLLVIPFLIVGCAATSEKIITPSGKKGYSIDCGAHPQKCYKKAGELCLRGYDVIDTTAQPVFIGDTLMSKNHMVIECK